jgi:putative spermidine/putrescine transport system permease protein
MNNIRYLGIALYTCFVIVPMAAGFVYAGLYSIGAVGVFSRGVTLEHWLALLSSAELLRSIALSVGIAAVTTICSVGIGFAAGVGLREWLQRGVLSFVAHVPLAMPTAVAAFVVFQVFSGGGFAARLLMGMGIISSAKEFPSLVHDSLGAGIVLAHTMLAAPFFALLFAQLYESEHLPSLAALASTLGASRSQRLVYVVAPVLLRRAAANSALMFVVVLGSYEIPLLLGLQSPQMLSVLAHRKYAMFDVGEKPQAFVVAIIYTAIVLVMLAVSKKNEPQT